MHMTFNLLTDQEENIATETGTKRMLNAQNNTQPATTTTTSTTTTTTTRHS